MNTNASHQVVCNHCGQVLGEYNSDASKGHISVSLQGDSDYSNQNSVNKEPFGGKGYNMQPKHYCSENCLGADLQKRAKASAKTKKVAKGSQLDAKTGILELNIVAEGYLKK